MKEIRAIIRPQKLPRLREVLRAMPGFPGMTVSKAFGCGSTLRHAPQNIKEELVASVESGSPAAKAGLAPGDVVLGVNGQKVDNSADLPRIIGEQKPGSVVRLSIWRDRKARDINVTLGEQLGEKLAAAGSPEGKGESASGKLGLTGRALTAQEAARLGVPGGVVVEGLGGPAAKAGLQPGDVIVGVNNQPITGIEQFRKLLDAAGNRFALLIQRGSSRIFLPVRIS